MCRLFKFKAKKRLVKFNEIKAVREGKEKQKAEIRERLMERYDLRDEYKEVFWAYRGDSECYSAWDEMGNYINVNIGDIVPYQRRGDLVFFYKIVGSRRKSGDYGFADSAMFYTLKYNHYEKIPQKVVDKSKSQTIKWEIENEGKYRVGYIQGVKVFILEVGKNPSTLFSKVEINPVRANFSDTRELNKYRSYDMRTRTIKEAKDLCKKIVKECKENEAVELLDFYIPTRISRKNA